jgi:HK97 family phage major capsid protein|tara:strand:+ start:4017 stop:5108 length:1092 start_codon:yes stop_codon:yes gene_type:complete
MQIEDILKKHADAVELKLGDLDQKTQEAMAIIIELEQKMARRGSVSSAPASWGEQFVDDSGFGEFKARVSSAPGTFRMDVKAITSLGDSGGAHVRAERDPNVNSLPGRQPRVRSLLTVLNTNSGSVEHVNQTTRDNNAAPAAEGTLKAESNYAWELATTPVRTIAHWTMGSVQVLEDAPQLMSIIDTELRYGLELEEDLQLLLGDGTGANLSGLIPNATAYADPLGLASPSMLDTLGTAMLQVALADRVPNGIAVHPSDWMRMRLLKDADGKYILGDPGANVEPRLFGLPVIATKAMTVDKFLVGDFAAAATLWDRHEIRVQVSTEDGDNFKRNMVTIRAEERLALAVKNGDALAYGDFGNVE